MDDHALAVLGMERLRNARNALLLVLIGIACPQNIKQTSITGDVCNLQAWEDWALKDNMLRFENQCRVALNALRLNIAGGHGPVKEEDVYEVMCSPECTLSDDLHQQIMEESKCNCKQLSTVYSNLDADFCSANSARMLCKQYKPLKAMGTRMMGEQDNLWAKVRPGGKIVFDQIPPSDKFTYIDAIRIGNWYNKKESSKGSIETCGDWNCPLDDFMCPRYEWNRKWICDDASALSLSRVVVLISVLFHAFVTLRFT